MMFINPGRFGAAAASITSALAWLDGDESLTTAVQAVPMDGEVYDTGNWHDTVTSNSRMTVPSGVSLARFVSNVATDASTLNEFAHRINGASFAGRGRAGSITTGNETFNFASAIVAVSATQYGETYKESSTSVTVIGDNRTWFAAEAIDAGIKYALVGKTGNQSISAGVTTTLTFDTETADTDAWHDNVMNNSRLTVPSGVTLVRVSANVKNNALTGGQNVVSMIKNGASARGLPERDLEGNIRKYLNVVSAPLEVSAGDYFEVQYFGTNAETVPASDEVWFAIEEVPSTYKRALVYKSAGQALSAATWTALEFGAEVYDTDSIHDNSTNNSRMTVPSGVTKARLSFNVKNPSTAGQLIAQVTKNGLGNTAPGLPADETETAGTDSINGFGAWVDVTAGDYFELEVWSTNAVTLGTDNELWFCMECQ
jgi:hypothetical protein